MVFYKLNIVPDAVLSTYSFCINGIDYKYYKNNKKLKSFSADNTQGRIRLSKHNGSTHGSSG
jgi:hypothetical protein